MTRPPRRGGRDPPAIKRGRSVVTHPRPTHHEKKPHLTKTYETMSGAWPVTIGTTTTKLLLLLLQLQLRCNGYICYNDACMLHSTKTYERLARLLLMSGAWPVTIGATTKLVLLLLQLQLRHNGYILCWYEFIKSPTIEMVSTTTMNNNDDNDG